MTKTFEKQPLIRFGVVDGDGDYISKEVMEKAVAEFQKRVDKNTVLITKAFSKELASTQGIVTGVSIEGQDVFIDGTILDTEEGQKIQRLMEAVEVARKQGIPTPDPVAYAMSGQGTPVVNPETGVREYKDVSITGVAVVEPQDKTK